MPCRFKTAPGKGADDPDRQPLFCVVVIRAIPLAVEDNVRLTASSHSFPFCVLEDKEKDEEIRLSTNRVQQGLVE